MKRYKKDQNLEEKYRRKRRKLGRSYDKEQIEDFGFSFFLSYKLVMLSEYFVMYSFPMEE